MGKPEFEPAVSSYFDRLNLIFSIRDIDLHIEEVTSEDKTVDLVVDIFNRVNSGGTKLSKGYLALAKICAEWPDARDEMKKRLDKWRRAGFHFELALNGTEQPPAMTCRMRPQNDRARRKRATAGRRRRHHGSDGRRRARRTLRRSRQDLSGSR